MSGNNPIVADKRPVKVSLEKGKKYLLKLSACYFPGFTATNAKGKEFSFKKPITLRVFAYAVKDKNITLNSLETFSLKQQSGVIENTEWEEIDFILQPDFDSNLLVIQAFYNTPTLFPYNGHVLVDKLSNIYEIGEE